MKIVEVISADRNEIPKISSVNTLRREKKWKYVVDNKNINARENAHKSSPSQTLISTWRRFHPQKSAREVKERDEGFFFTHTQHIHYNIDGRCSTTTERNGKNPLQMMFLCSSFVARFFLVSIIIGDESRRVPRDIRRWKLLFFRVSLSYPSAEVFWVCTLGEETDNDWA